MKFAPSFRVLAEITSAHLLKEASFGIFLVEGVHLGFGIDHTW
jgi:hypothetical protein